MDSSTEVIFSAQPGNDDSQSCIFAYTDGPTAMKVAKKRGRPKGSTKRPPSTSKNSHAAQSMHDSQKGFQFIHLDGGSGVTDAEARKTIRRQVMINYISRDKAKNPTRARSRASTYRNLCPQIPGVDPFDTLPIRIEPYMYDLLKYYTTDGWRRYYSIERYTTFNPMTEYWFSLAQTDGAFLHIILGCANLHLHPGSSVHQSVITVRHLNAAIAIVNRRIQRDEVPTDATLVVVSTMALIEKVQGCHENWKIHMAGLQKLVKYRGGLGSLESAPLALGKLYRADLVGSIDAAQKPYFWDRKLFTSTNSNIQSLNIGFQRLNQIAPFDEMLISCIQRTVDIIASLETLSKTHSHTEAAKARYWTTALQYTLLSATYSNPILEICRLALLLFSEILVNQSSTPISAYEMLIGKMLAMVETPVSESPIDSTAISIPPSLLLWAFLLAAHSTFEEQTSQRCLGVILDALSELELSTYEDVRFALGEFLWEFNLEHLKMMDPSHVIPLDVLR